MLAQRGVHVGEDDALRLELLVHLVVDDFRFVLGADAGQELPLGLGNPEAVEGVLDVLGDLGPVAAVLLGSTHEVVDVVEIDLVEIATPLRGRLVLEVLVGLEAELAHPFRLVLVLGNRFDDLAVQSLGGLVGVTLFGVTEAELLFVVGVDPFDCFFLGNCFGCRHFRPPG